jgi:hypothetical protein
VGDAAFDAARKAGRDVSLTAAFEEILSHAPPAVAPQFLRAPEPAREAGAPLEGALLGTLEILQGRRAALRRCLAVRAAAGLLLFLLAHPEGRSRQQIGVVFWPDASPTQVKNNFHVMLHHVRKAIGRADLIVFENERYRMAWEAGVRFDARRFEQSCPCVCALFGRRAERSTCNVRSTPRSRHSRCTVATFSRMRTLATGTSIFATV